MLSMANKDAQETIRALLAKQGKKGHHHHRHKHQDDSSDSLDSDDKEDKKKRKFAFISKAVPVSDSEKIFTEGATKYAADVKGYESNIALAVREFKRAGKPAHFPEVLSKELLLGQFIDVCQIKGELFNKKKGDFSYSTTGKEKGLEVSKHLTLEIDDLAEWQHYFSILKKAIEMGFPDCRKQISDYSEYINSQFWLGPIQANWKNITDYNAAFRSQVADRRYVCFSDWDHKDFDVLKTQYFGSSYFNTAPNLAQSGSSFSRPLFQAPFCQKGGFQQGPVSKPYSGPSSGVIPSGSAPNYVADFKHKGIHKITSSKDVGKMAEEYCFAFNSKRDCPLGDSCPRLHFCVVICRMSGDVVKNTADAITPEEYTSEKFLRGYQWDGTSPLGFLVAIESSRYTEPFPDDPSLEDNEDARYALKQYHYLFKISTPFKIDKMEQLLKHHPNPAFVKSVLKGLKDGFWPSSLKPDSEIIDVPNHKTCFDNQKLLEDQCEEEIQKGRYSEEFSTLIPGMKVIPLLMTSKKYSAKMRVCSNMSAGNPSPNDLIDKDRIKVSYDSLKSWIPFLIELKKRYGEVTIFKSDVEGAFRTLSAHLQYLIGAKWAQFDLLKGWNLPTTDHVIRKIAWAETVAIHLGMLMISVLQEVGGKRFLVLTDNTTSQLAVEKKRSGDRAVNMEWKAIQRLLVSLHADMVAHRVKSGDNLADLLSRGRDLRDVDDQVMIEMPIDLRQFVKQVVLVKKT
ncbi:uncharacterized protein MELLADRAFT_89666 [Melampsora larici-populina 98AG31]|uniref:C3H1-type domain-containing protein n=1 Tax=Melampsora larici-populina (strain 98AG31 / pathotype 3-4-7) TaxID=747676 RepID=F4RU59_MELLP|nr:uncharacterized protein MELLADRAFT_89666 [Melampsora larici-populina 98AG31]EGG04120.1 hypothetical protein MELLADRAFT_89666 [Melampsora larici-populina 98AG31]